MRNAAQYGNEPTLASLLELFKKGVKKEINCHQVGEIVSFDSDNQTAEVQIKMSYIVNGEIKQYPLLVDCPCVVLGGGQGRITFPIQQGDSCLVLFNDRDIDNWFSGGQTMQPRTERAHSFSDAIALVGIRNMQNKITDYLADGTELRYGSSTIKLQDGKITINGNVNIYQNEVDDNSLHAYVISSYHSGTDWYRVWSDGWCEQGGSFVPNNGNNTVAFHKPFKDTNYYFNRINQSAINSVATSFANEGYDTKTTASIDIYVNATYASGPVMWEAKGYIK